ncbi:R3H domain-containing protein 4-like [Symsagittifera roscoffensis]|uniref:R3H domain-containing protein 4-like n=1 Tax=Symsagittifera roscoffensis TaxID=84072 RepID=UPI00307B2F74
MGVRERARLVQSEPPEVIEVSSISSYSSQESLNSNSNKKNELDKQKAARRNLRGWLRKSKRATAPTAESHMKASSFKNSRRAGRLKGQLSCLAEVTEEAEHGGEAKPLDIYSFVDSTASAFTSVVSDQKLLQDWHEKLQHAVQQKMLDEEEESFDFCTDFVTSSEHNLELNPELCYRRIGKSARTQLRMPHKHHEALVSIEQELVDWFSAFPDSVMIKCMHSGYERLLFHSVCRYMHLSSYSVANGEMKSVNSSGARKTYVQNNLDTFHPPKLLLSEYLPKISGLVIKDETTEKGEKDS